jgi:hypothetical protein
MSTTPSTSEPRATAPGTEGRSGLGYTVVGSASAPKELSSHLPLSVVVLNRGGRYYRERLFREIESFGVNSIVSVEGSEAGYDMESLARSVPRLRFLIAPERSGPGERVNLAVEESPGPLVLVIWSDMRVPAASLSSRVVSKMERVEGLGAVPLLQGMHGEPLPSLYAPCLRSRRLEFLASCPARDLDPSVLPFDYVAAYVRDRFLALGGFDPRIASPWWQKLDLGFRAAQEGMRLACLTSFRLGYEAEPRAEDTTADASYRRFFLKNLSFKKDPSGMSFPMARKISYIRRSGVGLRGGLREYAVAREEALRRSDRVLFDARALADGWDAEGKER